MIEQNRLRMTYDNKAPCEPCSYCEIFPDLTAVEICYHIAVHVTLFMMRYSYRFGEYLSSERVV